MDPKLTMQEAADLRAGLGLALGRLIQEFEERTGLEVTSVDVLRHNTTMARKRELFRVLTTVELR